MEKLEELKGSLEEAERERDRLQTAVDGWEADSDDYVQEYEQMLNEAGPIEIGSLSYEAAQVLREVDPVAYRCGLADYVSEVDGEDDQQYMELYEALEEAEARVEELEERIEEYEERSAEEAADRWYEGKREGGKL